MVNPIAHRLLIDRSARLSLAESTDLHDGRPDRSGRVAHGLFIRSNAVTFDKDGRPVSHWETNPSRPAIQMEMRWTQQRPDGSILSQTPWLPMHSLVEQFIQLFRIQVAQASGSVVDTGSVTRTVTTDANIFRSDAAAAVTTNGLTVGTGSAAVALTNRALSTKIAEGSGVGQLLHRAMAFNAPTTTGDEVRMIITRQYQNSSGGTISISEVGWEALVQTWSFLLARDLISPAQDILNGNTSTLTLRLYTSTVGLIGLMRTLYIHAANANIVQVRTDGVSDTAVVNASNLRMQNSVEGVVSGANIIGLTLGTGSGVFSPTSNALTWIDSGTATGRLAYQENFFGSVTSNRRFTHRRAAVNGSAGSIIVAEVGANLAVQFGALDRVLGARILATAMTPSGNLTIADLATGVFELIWEI